MFGSVSLFFEREGKVRKCAFVNANVNVKL